RRRHPPGSPDAVEAGFVPRAFLGARDEAPELVAVGAPTRATQEAEMHPDGPVLVPPPDPPARAPRLAGGDCALDDRVRRSQSPVGAHEPRLPPVEVRLVDQVEEENRLDGRAA